jgi:sporulation protein YlmC with PRC-barrel domain
MNSLRVTSLICGGILSVTSSALLAQQSPSTIPSSSASSSSLGQGSGSSSLAGGDTSMREGHNMRLSHILNSPVQSQDGKTLGYIQDVTLDPRSGRIDFAILSLSSAGATHTSTSGETVPSSRSAPSSVSRSMATGKLIPVPWQLFSQSWNGDHTAGSSPTAGMHKLVLNLDESKLHGAPSFEANNWSELQNGTFDQQVYSYFGVDRASATGTPGSSISGQGTSSYGGNTSSSHPQSNTSPSR